jgi:signal peptidase I
MNLALILVSLTLFSGFFIIIDILFWKKKSDQNKTNSNLKSTILEYSYAFFPVLFFVLIIRSFIFEPFRIPSGSMKPTLLVGDFIFVKKIFLWT